MSTQRNPPETSPDKESLGREALVRKAKVCKDQCSICKRSRTKGGFARWFVKYVDRPICPYCKAYEKVYGCLAYEEPTARGR